VSLRIVGRPGASEARSGQILRLKTVVFVRDFFRTLLYVWGMSNPQERASTSQKNKKYLSIIEVSSEYGNSPGFWRKKVFLKQIPYVKSGRTVKISREDLDAWHAARKIRPTHPDAVHEECR
jgi:excisionase family DNA binding protein